MQLIIERRLHVYTHDLYTLLLTHIDASFKVPSYCEVNCPVIDALTKIVESGCVLALRLHRAWNWRINRTYNTDATKTS